MQQVNGVPVLSSDPSLLYHGLDEEPTWFSAQGGVYKCSERSTNRQVAIKKYLVEEENPYQDMFVMPKELVENEIYSMTKCIHDNILKLITVHLHEEFVYLIMPLCTGGSLQQYVFDHHLTVGQLVHIIISIASGLAKVHSHGYIHRDIKCDNIFLDQENNNIVIGDFGVVSISPAADSSVEEAGVVLFWSPELVQQKIVNHKVDIWALGIVILEVLNGGKAPYEDEKLEEEEIKQRILAAGKPEYPPNLPSRLVDLLDHCLDPDPRQRYSANSVLQHPFLKDYEPELLFPATKIDQDVSSQSDSEPLDTSMHDIVELSLDNSKNEQQQPTEQDMQYYNTETFTVLPLPKESPSAPVPAAKCRLPLPAFSVDKSVSAATPVKEKIANVIRKRQSMNDENRSQGSRIPMLSTLGLITEQEPEPTIEEETKPRLRSVKSVKLNSLVEKENTIVRQPLLRANTSPSFKVAYSNRQSIKSPPGRLMTTIEKTPQKRSPPKSPLTEIKTNFRKPKTTGGNALSPSKAATPTKKKELPPKSSIYRHKRLPGESRTARLMMGVSTNGRRQSFKQREEENGSGSIGDSNSTEKELPLTLGNRFGRIFSATHSKQLRDPTLLNSSSGMTPIVTHSKLRPLSFAASSSTLVMNSTPKEMTFKSIPSSQTTVIATTRNKKSSRRQSVPIPQNLLVVSPPPPPIPERRQQQQGNVSSTNTPKKTSNSNNGNSDQQDSLKSNVKALQVH